MRLFLIGAALALLLACRKDGAQQAPQPPDSLSDAAETRADTSKVYLALSLPCGEGEKADFRNDTSGDARTHLEHRLWDSAHSKYGYFVQRVFYEGVDWQFVSMRTCARLDFAGKPVVSPGGGRMAATGAFYTDDEAIITIARADSQGAKVEFKETLDDHYADGTRWIDDSTYEADLSRLQLPPRRRRYEFREGAWVARFVEVPPADSSSVPANGGMPFPEVSDSGSGG